MKVKNILVTTDFSDAAPKAYPAAAGLARKFEAKLHLVHSVEGYASFAFSSEGFGAALTRSDFLADVQSQLENEATHPSFRDLKPRPFLLSGPSAVQTLKTFEKENEIDLTVIASHGRTGVDHVIFGSFGEKIVRSLNSPVLTLRASAATVDDFAPRQVCVPFDFSDNARAVLPVVRFLAENFMSTFTFIFVVEDVYPVLTGSFGQATHEFVQKAIEETPAVIRKKFDELKENELYGVDAEMEVARGGPIAEILQTVKRHSPDLVLLSTHGWSGVTHFFLGSVAEHVVRRVGAPTLSVRSGETS